MTFRPIRPIRAIRARFSVSKFFPLGSRIWAAREEGRDEGGKRGNIWGANWGKKGEGGGENTGKRGGAKEGVRKGGGRGGARRGHGGKTGGKKGNKGEIRGRSENKGKKRGEMGGCEFAAELNEFSLLKQYPLTQNCYSPKIILAKLRAQACLFPKLRRLEPRCQRHQAQAGQGPSK